MNTQHGLQQIGATTIAELGIDGLNDIQHGLPGSKWSIRDRNISFLVLTVFAIELAVSKCQLMNHVERRP